VSLRLSDAARRQLDTWPLRSRSLFGELLEDAPSELQRELLTRALLAGHSAAELHAFADELRALSDEQAFDACTLARAAPEDHTVAQLLRAEADPLFAFELKGGTIDPAEDELPLSPNGAPTIELSVISPLAGRPVQRGRAFEADSHRPAAPRAKDWGELGGVSAPAPRSEAGSLAQSAKFLEDLLIEATRALSISWKELDLDLPGGPTLAEGLATAADALSRGIPVPCALGPRVGKHQRLALLLQTQVSGKSRAWQLYDPFSRELVWANEADLLGARELPFENKALRRLTRLVLPQSLRAVSF
jgi:hypothetical protein